MSKEDFLTPMEQASLVLAAQGEMGSIIHRDYLEGKQLPLFPKGATRPKAMMARVSSSVDKD